MSTQDPQESPVRVHFAPGLALSIPIIADRDVIDQLYAYAGTAAGAEVRAYALRLGITEPSDQHEWTIGWSSPGPDRPARLVWYQPDKLARIEAEVRAAIRTHPDADEITVAQGAGWDEIDLRITTPVPAAAHGDGAGPAESSASGTPREDRREPQQRSGSATAGNAPDAAIEPATPAGEGPR